MNRPGHSIAICCLAILVALYIVGAVSHGILRHAVQTLPLWIPIGLGFRRNEAAKWTALPCCGLWFFVMSVIWAFLLGWTGAITGHFSPVEIAMTIVVGVSCLVCVAIAARWRTATSAPLATAILIGAAALQTLALRISFLPSIANR
jgi:hypothetical protein